MVIGVKSHNGSWWSISRQSFMFSLFFVFFEALKVTSLFDGFYFSAINSFSMRIPCNSSIVTLSISFISLLVNIVVSNLKDSDLSTFCTIVNSSIFSPSPLMVLTISSTQRRYDATFSSYLIFKLSNYLYEFGVWP